jgi:predicted NBD/HSP70 family sugar kinase
LARRRAELSPRQGSDHSLPPPSAIGPEHLLALIRTGAATSRGALAQLTGMSRSTVAHRVDALIAAGYLREGGQAASSGGRPATVLEFDGSTKFVLAAALDRCRMVTGLINFAGDVAESRVSEIRIEDGPAVILPLVAAEFRALLSSSQISSSSLSGIGVAVPAPVDHRTGRPIEPTIMPGWHDCPIREELGREFGLPAYVDNDANVMALAEFRHLERTTDSMLYVLASDGIGAGLVFGGRLYRGAVGAAGALGHSVVAGSAAPCTCGNIGCIAAVAGGRVIAGQLADQGYGTSSAADIVALARQGNRQVTNRLRAAGRDLGQVLAGVVNLLDPGTVVIGGEFAEVEAFITGIREEVYRRALPLVAGHLQISKALLGAEAGIKGASTLVANELLAPRPVLDHLIPGTAPVRGPR